MKDMTRWLNLRLFGEGGATGGPSGSAGGEGAGAATSSVAHSDETEYVYGVQADTNQSSHASDSGTQQEDSALPSFDDLIKGDYKEAYEAKIKDAIDRRFKNQADNEATLKAYDDALTPLYDKYQVGYGDRDALFEAIGNDSSLYDDLAYEQGLTPEQYKHLKQLEATEKEHQEMLRQQELDNQAREQYMAWFDEGEKLKELYPNFDLASEVQNPDFIRDLESGRSVRKAYEAAHLDEIMAGALQRTAQNAAQGAINSIRARGMRPSENGASNRPGVVVKNDVNNLTDADLDRIVAQVRAGKTIRF